MSVAPPAQVQHARLGSAQPLARIEAACEPIPQNWPARPRALILVCGGRDYTDSAHVHSVLDALQPRAVVHGACGVDADRPDAPMSAGRTGTGAPGPCERSRGRGSTVAQRVMGLSQTASTVMT